MLTATAVKSAKPQSKQYKLSDSGGMYLLVLPAGGRYWRLKYRISGKEKMLALGVFPEMTLAEARERREEAKKLIKQGIDPSLEKQKRKREKRMQAENSLERIAREWHELRSKDVTPNYAKNIILRLEKDIFPRLGARPITDIKPIEILEACKETQKRGAIETAHRNLQVLSQVYKYAVVHEYVERDITADLKIKGALETQKSKHFARLEEKELPEFLIRLEEHDCELQTKLAVKFLIHTFVRTTELRGARWDEIDIDKREWRIPAVRMKMKEIHVVPLTNASTAILKQLREMNGHREHVFPNRNRPRTFISENTILYAIYRMGYKDRTTAHGFRALASTVLNENGFPADVIERQLAHGERNKIRAAYNHAQYLEQRREMMQWWSEYVEHLFDE